MQACDKIHRKTPEAMGRLRLRAIMAPLPPEVAAHDSRRGHSQRECLRMHRHASQRFAIITAIRSECKSASRGRRLA